MVGVGEEREGGEVEHRREVSMSRRERGINVSVNWMGIEMELKCDDRR
jgi:hypothetical protein